MKTKNLGGGKSRVRNGRDTANDTGSAAAIRAHAVQFYEKDEFLAESVARFVTQGLAKAQPVLVIATDTHQKSFTGRLQARGLDVGGPLGAGQLKLLNARDTLDSVMDGTMPDEGLFRARIGSLLPANGQTPGVHAHAYGEIVDLLWRDGNLEAAIRLEELWNDLARTHSFALLCAYSIENFHRAADSAGFMEVCSRHTLVYPAESCAATGKGDARLRQVSFLQQRAMALESEIEYHKQLEGALRDALADRSAAEAALQQREQDRQLAEAERERLFVAEKSARAEAEKASRLKDEFLTVLSHELRTPLNAILGWAHIITDDRSDAATIQRAFEVIRRNALLQLHLVDDLLDVSRLLSGKMQLRLHRVDLVAVLNAAADSVHPSAVTRGIDVEVSVDQSARFVMGDAERLQQVVWNLLSNAIKFTPEHGRIEVRLQRADAHTQIVVQDNGQGITQEFLPHVFERFRQADASATRKHGGLGLGLAVVRYLVEAHGGTVWADSAGEDCGSTFTVSLPLCADTMVADVVPVPAAR